jgi:hypothetical protein
MAAYGYYANVSRNLFFGYEPGDRMILGWEGETPAGDSEDVLERLYVLLNRDDRPTGRICHSMSIGDVVVLDGQAWACAREGWVKAEAPTNILNRTWSEAHDDYERASKDATLGVGHIWTTVACPAYRTLVPSDCTCRNG